MSFIKQIEDFQSARSLTDIINLTKISPDKVEFEKQTALEFFKKYIGNDCEALKKKLQEIERGDRVFG